MERMPTSFVLDAAARAALFTDARSNTHFDDRPVDVETIREVWELVKWGPTGNNTVPMRLAIAQSDQARAAVIDNAQPGNRPKLERAPLLLLAARDERFHDAIPSLGGSESAAARLDEDPVRRERMSHTGTMLQAGYFIIGLRAAGLAVRPYGGFDKAGMDAALLHGTSWRSEVLFGVGYPHPEDHGAGERQGRMSADQAVTVL